MRQIESPMLQRWDEEYAVIVESKRWELIQETLHTYMRYSLMNSYLVHLGTTLAEYAPRGYNEAQVARDSDGQMSYQEP